MEKKLGKIRSVKFGKGGYQDAIMGLTVDIDMKGSGVGHFTAGGWAISRSEYCKWTEEDRIKAHGEMLVKVTELLDQAKVDCVSQLKDVPVECTFEGMVLKSWRILEEVI